LPATWGILGAWSGVGGDADLVGYHQ
jgi:hypothetical protein